MKPNGNGVSEVIVSDATRSMSRLRSSGEIEDELNMLHARRDQICAELKQHQLRMAELNVAVRGKRLPQMQYNQICGEQLRVRDKILALENDAAEVKRVIRSLSSDSYLVKHGGGEKPRAMDQIMAELREIKRMLSRLMELD